MKKIYIIFCVLLMTSCAWVNDDIDDCPYGFWLNLHYTYNMLDVDAAPEYVKDVSIYVYDAEGNYVSRLDIPQSELRANSHHVRIVGLPEGDYQFVVWSGIGSSQYAVSGDKSTMDLFRLSLATPDSEVSAQLSDLYYGSLQTVHYNDSYASHDVYMMKNTNQLACLIVPMSQSKATLNPEDYDMRVVSANGIINVQNMPVADKSVIYKPFAKDVVRFNDAEYGELEGISLNISTLRLMKDLDCRLILEKKETGEVVFNISLPEYIAAIGALYTNLGQPLTVQEYLDRQDFYTIVFFLSEDLQQLVRLQVNSWRLRAKNHLKL